MKAFKILAAIGLCAAIAFGIMNDKSQAQQAPGGPLSLGGAPVLNIPSEVTAGATSNSVNAIIDCRGYRFLTIEATSTQGTNCTWNAGASVSGSKFDTNHYSGIFTYAAAGSTVVTNIEVDGINFVRIDSMAATGTITLSNSWKYQLK